MIQGGGVELAVFEEPTARPFAGALIGVCPEFPVGEDEFEFAVLMEIQLGGTAQASSDAGGKCGEFISER